MGLIDQAPSQAEENAIFGMRVERAHPERGAALIFSAAERG
jgi:hypothetical protein